MLAPRSPVTTETAAEDGRTGLRIPVIDDICGIKEFDLSPRFANLAGRIVFWRPTVLRRSSDGRHHDRVLFVGYDGILYICFSDGTAKRTMDLRTVGAIVEDDGSDIALICEFPLALRFHKLKVKEAADEVERAKLEVPLPGLRQFTSVVRTFSPKVSVTKGIEGGIGALKLKLEKPPGFRPPGRLAILSTRTADPEAEALAMGISLTQYRKFVNNNNGRGARTLTGSDSASLAVGVDGEILEDEQSMSMSMSGSPTKARPRPGLRFADDAAQGDGRHAIAKPSAPVEVDLSARLDSQGFSFRDAMAGRVPSGTKGTAATPDDPQSRDDRHVDPAAVDAVIHDADAPRLESLGSNAFGPTVQSTFFTQESDGDSLEEEEDHDVHNNAEQARIAHAMRTLSGRGDGHFHDELDAQLRVIDGSAMGGHRHHATVNDDDTDSFADDLPGEEDDMSDEDDVPPDAIDDIEVAIIKASQKHAQLTDDMEDELWNADHPEELAAEERRLEESRVVHERIRRMYRYFLPHEMHMADRIIQQCREKVYDDTDAPREEVVVLDALVDRFGGEPPPTPPTPSPEPTPLPPLSPAAAAEIRRRIYRMYVAHLPAKMFTIPEMLSTYCEAEVDWLDAMYEKCNRPEVTSLQELREANEEAVLAIPDDEPMPETHGYAEYPDMPTAVMDISRTFIDVIESPAALRNRIVRLYQMCVPDKVGTVDALLRRNRVAYTEPDGHPRMLIEKSVLDEITRAEGQDRDGGGRNDEGNRSTPTAPKPVMVTAETQYAPPTPPPTTPPAGEHASQSAAQGDSAPVATTEWATPDGVLHCAGGEPEGGGEVDTTNQPEELVLAPDTRENRRIASDITRGVLRELVKQYGGENFPAEIHMVLADERVVVKQMYRAEVERLYTQYCPERLERIDELLAKYAETPSQLIAAIQAKYNDTSEVKVELELESATTNDLIHTQSMRYRLRMKEISRRAIQAEDRTKPKPKKKRPPKPKRNAIANGFLNLVAEEAVSVAHRVLAEAREEIMPDVLRLEAEVQQRRALMKEKEAVERELRQRSTDQGGVSGVTIAADHDDLIREMNLAMLVSEACHRSMLLRGLQPLVATTRTRTTHDRFEPCHHGWPQNWQYTGNMRSSAHYGVDELARRS